MRTAFWLLIPLLLLAAPAAAQEDEAICVGGQRWRPSPEDVRRIEAEPIPASYRQPFESRAPCVRWGLDVESIVDWHMRFGDERGITAALAYLERDYIREAPAADRYISELERAWRAAQRDLRAAGEVRQPEGANHSAQGQFTEASRTIQRLEALLRVRENFVFLARHYLRAAEEFGSLALLDKAALYLRPALAGAAFLGPLEQQPPVAGVLYFNLHSFRTDELRMREAVLRAHLTRTPEAIARAEAALQEIERPLYRRLAETAFSGGDDFCDISGGWGGAEELAEACRAEDEMQDRVVPYWINRTMLGYIRPAGETRDDELVMRLLDIERLPDRGRCCMSNPAEDLFRLHLMHADQQGRAFTEAAARRDGFDAQAHLLEALEALRKAERLTPAFEAPARFRRVARSWLELWARGDAIPEEEGLGRLTASPDHRRYATYLRQLLAGLDRITAGADAGLPDSPD